MWGIWLQDKILCVVSQAWSQAIMKALPDEFHGESYAPQPDMRHRQTPSLVMIFHTVTFLSAVPSFSGLSIWWLWQRSSPGASVEVLLQERRGKSWRLFSSSWLSQVLAHLACPLDPSSESIKQKLCLCYTSVCTWSLCLCLYLKNKEMRAFWTLQNGFHGSCDSNVKLHIMGVPSGYNRNSPNHKNISHDCPR